MESVSPELATAIALHQAGRFTEAKRHYRQVLERTPHDFLAHKLLGDACSEEGQIEASAEHYRNAARCCPDAWLWQLRADIVAPVVFESSAAIDSYRTRLSERLSLYRDAFNRIDLNELAISGCKPPLSLAYQGRDDRPLKEAFASIFAERLPADLPRTNSGQPHVGFVVTQGNEGVFIRGMAGVLRHLDLRQLRVTIVCGKSAESKLCSAIGREVQYLPLADYFSDTIEAIRDAQFDLLYYWEIGTDCVNYFLPFFRLAPVQCTSWGWPVTSGIAEVDYFLSSERLEPQDADHHYTEQLIRLRDIPNYYELPPTSSTKSDQRPLDIDGRVYFCGQNPRKLHPDFDALIGQLLRCDPVGTVVLVEAAKPAITTALKRRLEKNLPDCVDRIRWASRMTQPEYLSWMATADCVLDTPHYSGGAKNSTYDAFAVSAPVVTLTGKFHRGRYTTAAYETMGMTDCIARTTDEYVNLAFRIAADQQFRRHIVSQITERRDVLFGNRAAVGQIQDFFLQAIGKVR